MKLSRSNIAWGALGAATLIIFVGLAVTFRPRSSASLPVLGTLPHFALLDQTARMVQSDEFLGHIMVADFIFLRCTAACPRLTSRMSQLRQDLDAVSKKKGKVLPVRFASFSVDPDHDTPEKLAPYADAWNATPSTWSFLTGPTAEVQEVVSSGFKVGYTRVEKENGPPDIMHGNYFVVVDGRGQIRGYYRTETPEEMQRLTNDVLALSRESSR